MLSPVPEEYNDATTIEENRKKAIEKLLLKQKQQLEEKKKDIPQGGFIQEDTTTDLTSYPLQETQTIKHPLSENPQCIHCKTIEIDFSFFKSFSIPICVSCKQERKEEYMLMTRTEAKDEYLLTESELKDNHLLPFIEKANPKRSKYAKMYLYTRKQLEHVAILKWKSLEAIEEEKDKRMDALKEKKKKRFQSKLNELRKKTRMENWKGKSEKYNHSHTFVRERKGDNTVIDVCSECGHSITFEEL